MADDAEQRQYQERVERILGAAALARSRQPNVVEPRAEPRQARPARNEGADHIRQGAVDIAAAPPVPPAGGRGEEDLGDSDSDGGDSDGGDGGRGIPGLCCCLSTRCCWLCFIMAFFTTLLALAVLLCLLAAMGSPDQPVQAKPSPPPIRYTVDIRVPDQVPTFLSDTAMSWSEVSRIQSWVRRPDSGHDPSLAQPVGQMLGLVTVNSGYCYASDRAVEMHELGRLYLYLDVAANVTADVSAARTALDSFIWRVQRDRDWYWFLQNDEPCQSIHCLGVFLAKSIERWRYGFFNKGAAAQSARRHIRWLDKFVTGQKGIYSTSFGGFTNVTIAVEGAAQEICAASWRMRTWQRKSQNLDFWWAVERQAGKEGLSLEGAGAISKLACDNGLRQAAEARAFGKGKLEKLAALYVVVGDEVDTLVEEMGCISGDDSTVPILLDLLLHHATGLRDTWG